MAAEGLSLSQELASEGTVVWPNGELVAPGGGVLDDYSGEPLTPQPMIPGIETVPVEGGAPCSSCGGGNGASDSYYNRCGACRSVWFPWFRGPGNCDNWCVGPHWDVSLDGLFLFREDADWDRVVADVGTAPELTTQFDTGAGARLFVTGYNCSSFGLQVGYEGVNQFNATALFPAAGSLRSFDYESRINSLEINFLRKWDVPWKPFAGVRYVEFGENFDDFTTVDKPIPPPQVVPPPPAAYVDFGTSVLLKNRLIGFQLGVFRDVWRLNRWITIEPYGNAGVYCNNFRRRDVTRTATTIITGDDLDTPENEFSEVRNEVDTAVTRSFTEVAFLGEAGVTVLTRINRCVALRGGYQAMGMSGVGQGLDAYFVPGFDTSTMFFHGMFFGVEYER